MNQEVNGMQARATFGGAKISMKVVAVVAAILVAYLLGGASGYVVKALSLSTATATQAIVGSQAYLLSDASIRTQHSGRQTVEQQTLNGSTASEPAARHGGLQLP